jgi:lysozyme family protein
MQAQAKQADALEATVKTAIATKSAIQGTKTPNLEQCLNVVLRQEGSPDRGGVTKFGITLEELQSSRNDQSLTAEHLKDLTRDQALEIYRVRYWNVLKCDELPAGVDLVVFDFGVDAGPSESAKVLQRAVGAEADGSIGPATMAATKGSFKNYRFGARAFGLIV